MLKTNSTATQEIARVSSAFECRCSCSLKVYLLKFGAGVD